MWIRAVLCALLCALSACGGSDSPPPAASEQPSTSPPPGQTPPTNPPTNPPPTNPPPTSNPAGPWPVADLTMYAATQGLTGTIIDASPDDAQNIWAVTQDALYVLRPGQTAFRRYTAAEGLHVQTYTDPATGQVTVSNITAMTGGHANEVFVGYRGYENTIPPPAPPSCCVPNADFSDPRWHLGQADKVTLNPDGTIGIRRYEFICDASFNCWEERSARRMVFGHSGTAAGHLFIGFDHGVVHVFNDGWGDHIHVETDWHYSDGRVVKKQGEQYGLAIFPNGDLLTAAEYGVGRQSWNVDPKAWVLGPYVWALTTYGGAEPYNTGAHSLDVPAEYREANRGAAITPDGTSWWVSLTTGLSSYTSGDFSNTRHHTNVAGLPASGLVDITADPDGTLWIVDNAGRLLRFNPSNLNVQVWPGVSNVRRVVVDTTVTPRAVYVSMGNQGLAVIRAR
jgi:hypothetical protein